MSWIYEFYLSFYSIGHNGISFYEQIEEINNFPPFGIRIKYCYVHYVSPNVQSFDSHYKYGCASQDWAAWRV